MKSIVVVFGTRPEAIKLAPVIRALKARPDARVYVCSTAQHREMLDTTMAAFQLEADCDLELMRPNQKPSEFLGRMLVGFQRVLDDVNPDVVVVQGDTMSVTGGALAGFLHGSQVAHVEAGLRTSDKRAPFPEEINRRVAGVVTDWHFPPTAGAKQALLREHVDPATITVTGNTGIDALLWMREQVAQRPLPAGIELDGRRLVLVTAHRRESFGQSFRDLCEALRTLALEFDDLQLVYPVHLNPNVQAPVREILSDCKGVLLIDPLPYPDLINLMVRSEFVITDSGGIQEEAPSLGKPVLVLRDKTERPEAVDAGVARLVGTERGKILGAARALLSDASELASMARPVDLYGDGKASQRIAECLLDGELTTAAFEPSRR